MPGWMAATECIIRHVQSNAVLRKLGILIHRPPLLHRHLMPLLMLSHVTAAAAS
jgi:hypothetical protein